MNIPHVVNMSNGFPHLVAGRISDETLKQMKQAHAAFGVTEGALVRMALIDYMPKYMGEHGNVQDDEIFAKLTAIMEAKEDPKAKAEFKAKLLKSFKQELAELKPRRKRAA